MGFVGEDRLSNDILPEFERGAVKMRIKWPKLLWRNSLRIMTNCKQSLMIMIWHDSKDELIAQSLIMDGPIYQTRPCTGQDLKGSS